MENPQNQGFMFFAFFPPYFDVSGIPRALQMRRHLALLGQSESPRSHLRFREEANLSHQVAISDFRAGKADLFDLEFRGNLERSRSRS